MDYDTTQARSSEDASYTKEQESIYMRFNNLINMFNSRKNASIIAEKSSDMLSSYAKGVRDIPLSVAIRLTKAKGVSLNWLATGEGDMLAQSSQETINSDLLATILAEVEKNLPSLDSEKKARITAKIYQYMIKQQGNPPALPSLQLGEILEIFNATL